IFAWGWSVRHDDRGSTEIGPPREWKPRVRKQLQARQHDRMRNSAKIQRRVAMNCKGWPRVWRRILALEVEIDCERILICHQAARRKAEKLRLLDRIGGRSKMNAVDVFSVQTYVERRPRSLRRSSVLQLQDQWDGLPGAHEQIGRQAKVQIDRTGPLQLQTFL